MPIVNVGERGSNQWVTRQPQRRHLYSLPGRRGMLCCGVVSTRRAATRRTAPHGVRIRVQAQLDHPTSAIASFNFVEGPCGGLWRLSV